jgi:hypothetical protein
MGRPSETGRAVMGNKNIFVRCLIRVPVGSYVIRIAEDITITLTQTCFNPAHTSTPRGVRFPVGYRSKSRF